MTHQKTVTPETLTADGWKLFSAPLPAGIGDAWARRGEDGWVYGMLLEERHCNRMGIIHGGILLAIADHFVGMCIWEAVGRKPAVTAQLNTHFISGAHPGEFVEISSQLIRHTRDLAFVRGTLSVGDRVVTAVDGIWKFLHPR
jgi:acyl-coenzyme A thioesterase PaaI-like protein